MSKTIQLLILAVVFGCSVMWLFAATTGKTIFPVDVECDYDLIVDGNFTVGGTNVIGAIAGLTITNSIGAKSWTNAGVVIVSGSNITWSVNGNVVSANVANAGIGTNHFTPAALVVVTSQYTAVTSGDARTNIFKLKPADQSIPTDTLTALAGLDIAPGVTGLASVSGYVLFSTPTNFIDGRLAFGGTLYDKLYMVIEDRRLETNYVGDLCHVTSIGEYCAFGLDTNITTIISFKGVVNFTNSAATFEVQGSQNTPSLTGINVLSNSTLKVEFVKP